MQQRRIPEETRKGKVAVLEEAYEYIADLGIDVESIFNSTKSD